MQSGGMRPLWSISCGHRGGQGQQGLMNRRGAGGGGFTERHWGVIVSGAWRVPQPPDPYTIACTRGQHQRQTWNQLLGPGVGGLRLKWGLGAGFHKGWVPCSAGGVQWDVRCVPCF